MRSQQKLCLLQSLFRRRHPNRIFDPSPVPQRSCQNFIEPFIGRVRHRAVERPRQRRAWLTARLRQHIVDRLPPKVARLQFIEDRKSRRHARFQRKSLQQPLREGMDRLNLEAARRFDRSRKERPRPGDVRPPSAHAKAA